MSVNKKVLTAGAVLAGATIGASGTASANEVAIQTQDQNAQSAEVQTTKTDQQTLTDQQKIDQAQQQVNQDQQAVDDATKTANDYKDNQLDPAKEDTSQAQQDVNDSQKNVTDAQNTVDQSQQQVNQDQQAVDQAITDKQTYPDRVADAENQVNQDQQAVDQAQDQVTDAQQSANDAQQTVDQAQQDVNDAQQTVNDSKDSVDQAQDQVDQDQQAVDNAANTVSPEINQANDEVNQAKQDKADAYQDVKDAQSDATKTSDELNDAVSDAAALNDKEEKTDQVYNDALRNESATSDTLKNTPPTITVEHPAEPTVPVVPGNDAYATEVDDLSDLDDIVAGMIQQQWNGTSATGGIVSVRDEFQKNNGGIYTGSEQQMKDLYSFGIETINRIREKNSLKPFSYSEFSQTFSDNIRKYRIEHGLTDGHTKEYAEAAFGPLTTGNTNDMGNSVEISTNGGVEVLAGSGSSDHPEGQSVTMLDMYTSELNAIYMWLYQDAASNWGHRNAVLRPDATNGNELFSGIFYQGTPNDGASGIWGMNFYEVISKSQHDENVALGEQFGMPESQADKDLWAFVTGTASAAINTSNTPATNHSEPYTTEETNPAYTSALNAYNSAKQAVKDTKAAWDAVHAEISSANARVDQAKLDNDAAQTKLENAKNALMDADAKLDAAQQKLDDLIKANQSAVDKAVADAQAKLDQSKSVLSQAQQTYDQALSDLNTANQKLNTAKINKENADQVLANANQSLKDAQAKLTESQSVLDKLHSTNPDTVIANAQEKLNNSKIALDTAKAKLMTAKQALDLANQKHTDSKKVLDIKKTEYDRLLANVKTLTDQLHIDKNALQKLLDAQAKKDAESKAAQDKANQTGKPVYDRNTGKLVLPDPNYHKEDNETGTRTTNTSSNQIALIPEGGLSGIIQSASADTIDNTVKHNDNVDISKKTNNDSNGNSLKDTAFESRVDKNQAMYAEAGALGLAALIGSMSLLGGQKKNKKTSR